jgi:hypothetical protein
MWTLVTSNPLHGRVFTPLTVAWPEGLEPPTHVLEGHCSIQMSYGQIVYRQGECGLQARDTVQINHALR